MLTRSIPEPQPLEHQAMSSQSLGARTPRPGGWNHDSGCSVLAGVGVPAEPYLGQAGVGKGGRRAAAPQREAGGGVVWASDGVTSPAKANLPQGAGGASPPRWNQRETGTQAEPAVASGPAQPGLNPLLPAPPSPPVLLRASCTSETPGDTRPPHAYTDGHSGLMPVVRPAPGSHPQTLASARVPRAELGWGGAASTVGPFSSGPGAGARRGWESQWGHHGGSVVTAGAVPVWQSRHRVPQRTQEGPGRGRQ